MDNTWDALIPAASADVKIEASPADSLLSDPTGAFSSLFSGSTVASSDAATPTDSSFSAKGDKIDITNLDDFRSMTPLMEEEDALAADAAAAADASAAAGSPDKKPAKKRKSWGQVLPEPKTNLPPRKRAKTEDEKEQRRVERVLRNRRAAQSSRERKRLEVEALERRNQELELLLQKARSENLILYEQLTRAQGKPSVLTTGNAPVTLSQELFGSQNGHSSLLEGSKPSLGSFIPPSQTPQTIDPVSLSPALTAVPDPSDPVAPIDKESGATSQDQQPTPLPQIPRQQQPQPQQQQGQLPAAEPVAAIAAVAAAPSKTGPSPDTTQRPAATLCPDLQCLSAEATQAWKDPRTSVPLAAALFCQMTLLLTLSSTVISACCRPLTQIALFLRAGISIPPTPAILNSIIWLTTTPSRRSLAATSTSPTFSTPTGPTSRPAATSSSATAASPRPGRPFPTLRLKMLRKILTSNPMLARPLTDATMRVLRSVCSEKPSSDVARVGGQASSAAAQSAQWSKTGIAPDGTWQDPATRPSKEALLTLLWAIRVEEKRMTKMLASSAMASPGGGVRVACSQDKRLKPFPLDRKRSRDAFVDGYVLAPGERDARKQRRL